MIEIYLTENVTLLSSTRDSWGEAGTPVETSFKVRNTGANRLVTSKSGEQVLSKKTLLLVVREISFEDRIRLVDGEEYTIASINTAQDFGPQFMEMRLI